MNANTGSLSFTTIDNTSSGTLNAGGAALTGQSITNEGNLNYSADSITANVENAPSAYMSVSGGGTRILHGNLTNDVGGTIKTTQTILQVTGTFTNNGTFSSDPADNYFHNMTVGLHGALVGGSRDRFFVSGNLISTSANNKGWSTAASELLFQGGASHIMSVDGAELGESARGYQNNFAWGTFSLAAGEDLILQDGNSQPGGALYVHSLLLGGGIGQIDSIQGDGVNIYYDPSQVANKYLEDASYALADGGYLRPDANATQVLVSSASYSAVPEPRALGMLCVFGALDLIRRRRQQARMS